MVFMDRPQNMRRDLSSSRPCVEIGRESLLSVSRKNEKKDFKISCLCVEEEREKKDSPLLVRALLSIYLWEGELE
jgi:hypothetical protein